MAECGFSSGFSNGFEVCDVLLIRPRQAPSFGRVARPSLIDPILLVRPEGAPLRELAATDAALRRRLRAN